MYLMMMNSLAVAHGMPCIPSLSSLINSVVRVLLLILTHVAIQIVIVIPLTPFMECLWYVKFLTPMHMVESRRQIDRMKDQRTSYGAKDKHSLVQQICV